MFDKTGKDPLVNRIAMRCYLCGILFPFIYLTIEPYKSDRFIRFHAFQSIMLWLTWGPLTVASDSVQFHVRGIGKVLSVSWTICLFVWIASMVAANKGYVFKLPIVGALATRYADKR